MKRFTIMLTLATLLGVSNSIVVATENMNFKTSVEIISAEHGVVFRKTQKLTNREGSEIYLYTNGKCEMYYNDRCEVVCYYTVTGNEIKLLDEKGNTIYTGTFTYTSDRQNVQSLTIAGTKYYKK